MMFRWEGAQILAQTAITIVQNAIAELAIIQPSAGRSPAGHSSIMCMTTKSHSVTPVNTRQKDPAKSTPTFSSQKTLCTRSLQQTPSRVVGLPQQEKRSF